jgi:hypothetical protein
MRRDAGLNLAELKTGIRIMVVLGNIAVPGLIVCQKRVLAEQSALACVAARAAAGSAGSGPGGCLPEASPGIAARLQAAFK